MREKLSDHYLAGFIDGEGCLALEGKVSEGRRWYRPRLSIGNTSLLVLQRIQETIGAGFIQQHSKRPSHHRPTWQYNLYGKKSLEPLLVRLEPLLVIKGEQARELLAFMSIMHAGKKLTASDISIREAHLQRMHVLNKRGAA